VTLAFNGFGQVTADKQTHGEPVNSGTPEVEYDYADSSRVTT
jgi:hypothetical protein